MSHSKMHKKRNPLNDKQRKFVENYLRHGNAKQAAIQAGYARAGAGTQAYDMLNKNKTVMWEVEKARKKSDARAAYNYEQAMSEFEHGMKMAEDTENAGAYIKGAEMRSKLSGLLVEKLQVSAGFQIQISGITDEPREVQEGVAQIAAADIMRLIGDNEGEDDGDEGE